MCILSGTNQNETVHSGLICPLSNNTNDDITDDITVIRYKMLQNKDVATNMLKQKKEALHHVAFLKQDVEL